jgi:hypothetical protein
LKRASAAFLLSGIIVGRFSNSLGRNMPPKWQMSPPRKMKVEGVTRARAEM